MRIRKKQTPEREESCVITSCKDLNLYSTAEMVGVIIQFTIVQENNFYWWNGHQYSTVIGFTAPSLTWQAHCRPLTKQVHKTKTSEFTAQNQCKAKVTSIRNKCAFFTSYILSPSLNGLFHWESFIPIWSDCWLSCITVESGQRKSC